MRDKLHVSSHKFCSGNVDTLCNQIFAIFWKFLFRCLGFQMQEVRGVNQNNLCNISPLVERRAGDGRR